MLLHHDVSQPLYLIGSGVVTEGEAAWLRQESNVTVKITPPETFAHVPKGSQCMLGFWTMHYRNTFFSLHDINQYDWPIFLHPRAVVGTDHERIGKGTIVYPLAYIGHDVTIGPFGLIGQLSSIGYGTKLGENVVVGPGTVIGGSTTVDNNVFFGQSCSIKDKIFIADTSSFCMNSVVTKSIEQSGKYFGNRKVPVQ